MNVPIFSFSSTDAYDSKNFHKNFEAKFQVLKKVVLEENFGREKYDR